MRRNATPGLYRLENGKARAVELLPSHEAVSLQHLFVSHTQAVVCPDPRGRNGEIVSCSAWPGLLVELSWAASGSGPPSGASGVRSAHCKLLGLVSPARPAPPSHQP